MRYAALVSGGVDSAVALHQVARQAPGQVRAYYLKIWLEEELSFLGSCPWEEDLHHARAVCASAGVPLEVVPLQEEYYQRVVSYTLDELRAGRTPSPDIFCNQRIKFGAFFDALRGEADRIVTGHYARVSRDEGGGPARLAMAPDPVKDQTYFLSHLSQEQLSRAEFPLGTLTKAQVRERAAELNLSNRDRPDSQGICFLGKIRYSDFVRHYLGEQEGPIVEHETGRELGRHRGAWFFTVGQRQGLGLGNGPWYVTDRNIETNLVRVSHAERVLHQARETFEVGAVHALADPPRGWVGSGSLQLKLRHGPDLIPCRLEPSARGFRVTMDRADRGVAPGQFAVFYDPPECLGSAMILPREDLP
ncbi:tRNA 2-thiouridine(34) synthase MnmA [Alkalispirochaeta alkalica]|uniref:tRNA 2-thiouridine(34) synthase MnmA n=1 Tax=Alkalispirochaeta alkalica TaxID=46356 RepID=UPI0003661561|nr:tRNA 2-thiouridine(34) synthase MnmA [Alkalispirochaeta alkalica]